MKILYHLTVPPPVISRTEAIWQEAELLRTRFGGEIISLLPSSRPSPRFPRPFYGLHCLRAIRRLEREVDLHHIYHSDLYFFPFLRFLRKPVVYSVVAGLGPKERLPSATVLRRVHRIVVQDNHDLELLAAHGLTNGHLIRPGVDVGRFRQTPPPTGTGFVLMAGSAPWTREQFGTKGVEALLRVARQMPDLRLVFLWRGLLLEELHERIESQRLADRVEVLNERVDVNEVLARVHAAVVLANQPRLIKAYPHSLLEALACGRPVVVSDRVPMARYVQEKGCGQVVLGSDDESLSRAIQRLRDTYDACQINAARMGGEDFRQEDLVTAYRKLYASIAG